MLNGAYTHTVNIYKSYTSDIYITATLPLFTQNHQTSQSQYHYEQQRHQR